jgi:hypothetical protein
MIARLQRGVLLAVVLFLVLPTLAGAPAPAPAAAPVDPETVAIAKLLESFMDALCTADIERFQALFAPDATVFFPLPALPLRLENKEQVVKAFGAFFEAVRRGGSGPRYMNLVAQDVRIQRYGPLAVVTFHLKGPEMISRRSIVVHKQGGSWLIVHVHASNQPVQK